MTVWNYTSLLVKEAGHPHLKKEGDCQDCNNYQDTNTLFIVPGKLPSHLLFIKNSEPTAKVAES